MAAITSTIDRLLVGDYLIADWEAAGLIYPSVATGVIRTVKQWGMMRRLGSVTPRDMVGVETNLRLSLNLRC